VPVDGNPEMIMNLRTSRKVPEVRPSGDRSKERIEVGSGILCSSPVA
jgi:hypothetical protein